MTNDSSSRGDLPVCLTCAGSDSGGGAGIQADLLTFTDLATYGTTALTALTAQNPEAVSGVLPVEAEFVAQQLDQVTDYYPVAAMKTGMLFNARIIEAVASFLARHKDIPVVVDPVMVATSGAQLLEDEAVVAMQEALLKKAALLTPNLDEVKVLLQWRPETPQEMADAARELSDQFGTAVLVKGGHLEGDTVVDLLLEPGSEDPHRMESTRVAEVSTHGSGCTLSAAITAFLARGETLPVAVEQARTYLHERLQHPWRVGGEAIIAHRS